jgi:carbon monoxide dehydrogenase subunit G
MTCGVARFAARRAMECRHKQRCLPLMPIRRSPVSSARLLLAALVSACAIGFAPFARAAAVSVDVERRGQGILIEASTRLDSDPATAWRVLTDYERYGDFIPGVISSHVVDRRGSTVVVEQSDQLPLWLLRMPLHVTYAIREFPPNLVQSRATTGALPALESSYLLTPAGFGVRLDYVGHVDPGGLLLAGIEERVFRQRVLRQFTALADEIERRSAVARRVD